MAKDSPHGSRHRYRSGCRCDACCKAASASVLSYRRHDPAAKQKRAAQSRAWYAKNKERQKDVQRAYRLTAKGRAVRAHHRAKRLDDAPFTAEAIEYAAILFGDPCSYCDGTTEVPDHITPIALGGLSEVDNLTGACRACNASKYSHRLLLWLAGRQ